MNAKYDQRTSPRLPCRGLSRWIAVILLFISSYPLRAHDPPVEYYGRNITVDIEPGSVHAVYRLEISQVTLFNLPEADKQIKLSGVKDKKTYAAACLERFKVLVPDKLLAFMNGQPLKWSLERTRTEDKGSIEYIFYFRADYSPRAGENRCEIADTNFVQRTKDAFKLKLDAGTGIAITELNEPREGPRSTVDESRQMASVRFHIEPAFLAKINLEIGLRYFNALLSPDETYAIVPLAPPPVPIDEVTSDSQAGVWELLRRGDLAGALSHNHGFWLLILIALVHGAGHSLMPGHGKTMVAAYLVGERGTPWHAVLLGIVTTLTHTSAAIAIAVVIRFTTASAQHINALLLFIGGLMMAGIGFWLFLQRLAGRSDHVHLFDMGHAHSHGEARPVASQMGTIRLVLLGIAGGIIPCWGAILWVIGCITTSQFWLALPIVLAFSVGLSSVLILLGLSVVYSGRIGSSRWGGRAWFQQTIRWLPIFGAIVVVAIGLFMCATSGISG